jgi:putative ABC transport system ATP-binding protein
MDRFRGKRIGIVFQKSHFVQALNVMENLMLSVWLSEKKNQKERALELLSRLGLIEKSKEKVYALSAGQQQRLSIARALINNAGLILADEPTSSLDDLNCEKVIELLINEANQTGASLIVVTHDQRIKPFFENKYFLQ